MATLSPDGAAASAAEAAKTLEETLGKIPPTAVILGSGWGALVEGSKADWVSFERLGFGRPAAGGHAGRVGVVDGGGTRLLVQDGRLHCYEGFSSLEVCFPIWAYADAGVRLLFLLSAAGGLNPVYSPGDLMIVRDHMMLWGENPLRGLPHDGARSPHIAAGRIYSERLQEFVKNSLPPGTNSELGTYVFVPGPSYETPAEATLLRIAGADAVGMSTAPEALTACYLGMEVAAVCCITNVLLPPQLAIPPSHESVIAAVGSAVARMPDLLERLAAGAG